MPNAIDRFSQVYNQVRTRPPATGGPAPAPTAPSPYAPAPASSVYIPDPRRTQASASTQAPWNNPNYPTPSTPTPPFVPPQSTGYPGTFPVQYPSTPQSTYPTSYPGSYPGTYPGTSPYGYSTVGPLTAVLGSLTPVVKDQGYQKFVRETAPIIDTAIPLIGTIVGLIGSTRKSSSPGTPQSTMPAAPTPAPIYPAIPQQTYPQQPVSQPYPQPPVYPSYPQQPSTGYGYGTGSSLAWPGSGSTISIGGTSLGEGIQQVGNLVDSIGRIFK